MGQAENNGSERTGLNIPNLPLLVSPAVRLGDDDYGGVGLGVREIGDTRVQRTFGHRVLEAVYTVRQWTAVDGFARAGIDFVMQLQNLVVQSKGAKNFTGKPEINEAGFVRVIIVQNKGGLQAGISSIKIAFVVRGADLLGPEILRCFDFKVVQGNLCRDIVERLYESVCDIINPQQALGDAE